MKPRHILAMIFAAVVVFYPLSWGPALQIARARNFTGLPGDAFWPLYKPLNSFVETVPALDQLMARYLNWWLFDLFPERRDAFERIKLSHYPSVWFA